jgi:cation diffusion facilitator CzcD-associated flavoprotein CzcO
MSTEVDVAIVGAGFSGLGAAIRLKRAGWTDFVVLEQADEVGGTWRDNTYPGCACDVPSHLYSFSFSPNPRWSRTHSEQPEIWDYLRRCVTRHELTPHLRLGHEVRSAGWDESTGRWLVDTSQGRFSARVLVAAPGPLTEPAVPKLPGLETFAGTAFHSARWDHGHDLAGRRVAVIGTGASAIQFVPRIQPRVARLTLFQRTPPWIIPRGTRPISDARQRLFRSVPLAQRAFRAGLYWSRERLAIGFLNPKVMNRVGNRLALRHLHRQVPDPQLRAKLTPSYTMGCKRVLISDDYLPALTQDNVDVVTEGIAEVRPHAVVTRDGVEHPADTIIFGTGFHVSDRPIAQWLRGRDGLTLAEAWGGSPKAYLGLTVAGFPNLFLLLGPNSGVGHSSILLMLESQLNHLIAALRHMRRQGVHAVEPTADAQRGFVARVDRRMAGTVWAPERCQSWYRDATGRNFSIWPGHSFTYRWRLRRFDARAYRETTV